jgi:trehalose 6-phosphate synthase/phosphatase
MPVLSTRVHFRWAVESSQFEIGDRVVLVGSAGELGNGDIKKGIELVTTDETFPIFSTIEPVILKTRKRVDYQYYVITGNNGLHEKYHDLKIRVSSENKWISPTGREMTVEDDQGRSRIDNPPLSKTASADSYRARVAKIKALEISTGPDPISKTGSSVVYVVTMQLPVQVVKSAEGEWQVFPGKAAWLSALYHNKHEKPPIKMMFVGWPGLYITNPKEQQELSQILLQHDCIPVFLPKTEASDFLSFCGKCLWPTCHGVSPQFEDSQWACYQWVNQKYADAVVRNARDELSDSVWVHDYHLLLLPMLISRRLARCNIGFFLHTPFPTVDIYRTLPVRDEIMRALLCADLIVFQFYEYARHFLVACKRLLGMDHSFRPGGFLAVDDYCGRKVNIRASHVCLSKSFTLDRVSPLVTTQVSLLKAEFEGKLIIAGFDRCDRLAGLLLKLKGFQMFLLKNPEWVKKVVFLQYTFFPNIDSSSEKELGQEISKLAQKINADFHMEIVRVKLECSQTEKYALLLACDILLDGSLKDGLNVVPFEYLMIRQQLNVPEMHSASSSNQAGVLICSEFSGCSRVLTNSLRINPWDITQTANSILEGLCMSEQEKTVRFKADSDYVMSKDMIEWGMDLHDDLRRFRKPEDKLYFSVGFGSRTKLLGIDQNFEHFKIEAVVRAYRNSKNRLILLDNEGTLESANTRVFKDFGNLQSLHAHGSPPSLHILDCLRAISADEVQNTVVITSGRSQELLSEWFGSVSNTVGLAAEHGFFLKVPVLTGAERGWSCITPSFDMSWKSPTFELMTHYVKRTQGTFIENKGSALVWQYRDADPDFGQRQARELHSALEDLLISHNFPVDVTRGKGYVEVKLHGVNKGAAATNILNRLTNIRGLPDFVLCVGDDRSDESMFEAINSSYPASAWMPEGLARVVSQENLKKPTKFMSLQDLGLIDDVEGAESVESSPYVERRSGPEVFTVKIGGGRTDTHAKFYLEDVEAMTRLLEALKKASEEKNSKLTQHTISRTRKSTAASNQINPKWMTAFNEAE